MKTRYFYRNITDEQFAALSVGHFMTVLGGIRYVGTNSPVSELSSQEVVMPEGYTEEEVEQPNEPEEEILPTE